MAGDRRVSDESAEEDFLDTHGRAVHPFSLDMANLGTARLGRELVAMLESGAWRTFKDGLGNYQFLPGEFDYFLSQQGVDRDHVMQGVRDVAMKARLEEAMDERRTGDEEYRRPLELARKVNPQRPDGPSGPTATVVERQSYWSRRVLLVRALLAARL